MAKRNREQDQPAIIKRISSKSWEHVASYLPIEDITTLISVIMVEKRSFKYMKNQCLKLFVVLQKSLPLIDSTNGKYGSLHDIITVIIDSKNHFNRKNTLFLLNFVTQITKARGDEEKKFTLRPIDSFSKISDIFWVDLSNHSIKPLLKSRKNLSTYEPMIAGKREKYELLLKDERNKFAMDSSSGDYSHAIFYLIVKELLVEKEISPDEQAKKLLFDGSHIFSKQNNFNRSTLFTIHATSKQPTINNEKKNHGKKMKEENDQVDENHIHRAWIRSILDMNQDHCNLIRHILNMEPPISSPIPKKKNEKTISIDLIDEDESESIDEEPSSLTISRSSDEISISEEEEEIATDDDDEDDDEDDEYGSDYSISDDTSSSFCLTSNDDEYDDDEEEAEAETEEEEEEEESEEISTTY
jgi:hypothetical protein